LRFVLAAVAILPFLFEGALLVYTRWARVLGLRIKVGTPVLDHIGQFLYATHSLIVSQFQRVPWNPTTVIIVGICSCTACMLLLRGRGSRVQ
jgi:hypothetical protein